MNDLTKSARWSRSKKAADELTKDYGSPPIPVLEIAEKCGVDVVFANFDEAVAGFCDFSSAKLFVNDIDPINRRLLQLRTSWVIGFCIGNII